MLYKTITVQTIYKYKYSHTSLIRATIAEQQPFYGPLSSNTRVNQYQKKHTPTHLS